MGKKKRSADARFPLWWCETDQRIIRGVISALEEADADACYARDNDWVDWDAIAPEGMSGQEAKERWEHLAKEVPKRRTNLEIARIVQKNFNGAKATGNVLTPTQYTKVANMRRHPQRLKAQDLYPDFPKRPMSAFFLWAEDQRESIRVEMPDAQARVIQRVLGERWRDIPENVKDVYKQRAAEAMERYYAEMDKFYHVHPEAKVDKKLARLPAKKPKLTLDAPKPPPRSGYLLFLQEVRSTMPDVPFTDAVRHIAAQWQALSEEVKASYARRLDQMWSKHDEEWEAFVQSMPEHQRAELERMRPSSAHPRHKQSPSSTAATSSAAAAAAVSTAQPDGSGQYSSPSRHTEGWRPPFRSHDGGDVNARGQDWIGAEPSGGAPTTATTT
ncbi:hypothetical protein PTSG_04247 [Salpingoeca rosetta]|uniref:HMG box domain-containing protein n=1 Tax=Salpingoeca rosetta (strain ATCC 50818 / BSB-021) TaxID=946362 RepID=F2U707_SALR5|nr:uncharacterized protein PTSG_04247 [Salpingoeca rosetta]EGD83639.1 hypothetical protein PTSG_04247 [Salpingoeca rosetta]|eukprot:XP_004995143.1 hypothetical protein PTSG_04247 [Salpingoeca rosetta]